MSFFCTKLMSICVIFQTSYPDRVQSVPVQPVTSWNLGTSVSLGVSPGSSSSINQAWTVSEPALLPSVGTVSQTLRIRHPEKRSPHSKINPLVLASQKDAMRHQNQLLQRLIDFSYIS